jgi:hypothetical protein
MFNPKPYGSYLVNIKLSENKINPIILIIFANGYEAIEYDVQINTGHGILSETATFSNYNFYPRYLRSKNKNGKQMIIQKESI